MVDVIVLERDELAFGCGAQPHPLLGARAMTDRLEHHFSTDDELNRFAKLPRRCGGERTMGPRPKLTAETRANELGDDADVLFRRTEHLGENGPEVENPLRFLVERQHRAIPDRARSL